MTPPAAATAAARRAVAAPARRAGAAPRPQRRISGPARPARPVVVPRRSAGRAADRTLGARALEWLRALPDHRLLDRLIGGRVWIVLLGGLLVGIVTMQLSLLRMNATIGRAVERTTVLEQHNAALRLSISQLSDTERIVGDATQMGFVMPPQGSPRFLTASAADAARALTTMRVPDPNAAAAAAAQLAASTPVATGLAPTDSAAAATTDPAGTTPVGTTTPVTTTTPSTTAPVTSTGVPPGGTPTSATTAAPVTAAAGGASAPVGPQG